MKPFVFVLITITLVILILETEAAYKWGKWIPLQKKCPRRCSQKQGASRHGRFCLSCHGGKCTRLKSNKKCKGVAASDRPCYIGSQCSGPGLYTGQWGAWNSKTDCPTTPCQGRVQVLTRKCLRTKKSGSHFKCGSLVGSDGGEMTHRECPCAKMATNWMAERNKQYLKHMNGFWEEWSPWTCIKECDHAGVKAYRKRKCTNFQAGYYCTPDENGLKEVHELPCKDKFGIKCFKKWSAWGDWSRCTMSCGGATQIRKRRCEGFGRTCKGKAEDHEPCPVMANCPVIDGRWGAWGRWELDCSVTCGDGVRKRIRKCNNPPPTGGGRTCEGLAFNTAPCEVKVICPVHGNWGEWTEWSCSVTCGTGNGTRTRKCDNPAPQFNGNFCHGSKVNTTDSCNNFTCPTVDPIPPIPEHILKAIDRQLTTSNHNLNREESGTVELICHTNVTRMFFKAFPDAAVVWIHNGNSLTFDPSRMKYFNGDLVIGGLTPGDSGVYTCQIEYYKNVSKIVDIFALTVNSNKTDKTIRATEKLELFCHGTPFGLLFPKTTSLELYFNGTLFRNFGPTPVYSLEPYVKTDTVRADSGTWVCAILDTATDRAWNTSMIRVYVGPAPPLWERLLKPKIIAALAGAAGALVVLFIGLCKKQEQAYEKRQKELMDIYKDQILENNKDKDVNAEDDERQTGSMNGRKHSLEHTNPDETESFKQDPDEAETESFDQDPDETVSFIDDNAWDETGTSAPVEYTVDVSSASVSKFHSASMQRGFDNTPFDGTDDNGLCSTLPYGSECIGDNVTTCYVDRSSTHRIRSANYFDTRHVSSVEHFSGSHIGVEQYYDQGADGPPTHQTYLDGSPGQEWC